MSETNQTPAEEQVDPRGPVIAALATNSENKRCYEVLAAVTAQAPSKEEVAEFAAPVTVNVPHGTDFYISAVRVGCRALVKAYLATVCVGILFALGNMVSGDCGQEFWRVDAQEACNALLLNSLALSVDVRCFDGMPANMTEDNWNEKCGVGGWIGFMISAGAFVWMAYSSISAQVGAMSGKVMFHDLFFSVESWNGKFYRCSYYADVTSAKANSSLDIKTKARIITKMDKDAKEKKDKMTLRVQGDAGLKMSAGSGEEREKFLKYFADRLPVAVEGFNNASAPAVQSTASMLDDVNLAAAVATRGARSKEPPTFDAVRKPLSCDFFTEVLFICGIVAVCWYGSTTVSKFIEWAFNNGAGTCTHELKPDVDKCAFWRIFVPIDAPLVTAVDYLGLIFLLCSAIAVPGYYFAQMPIEYRFHQQSKAVEEYLLAGWESQESKVFFPGDIQAMEVVWGSLEKFVKVSLKAVYTVKEGISNPFDVKIEFKQQDLKVGLVDNECASCSGHGQKAMQFKEDILSNLKKLAPDMLAGADVGSA